MLFNFFYKSLFLLLIGYSSLYALYEEPWGKDSFLLHAEEPVASSKASLPTKIMKTLITFHQKVLSPVDGPRSHFKPSSSNYMRIAMEKHGFIQGYLMGCDRLLRENGDPWVYRYELIDDTLWKVDYPP
mgnify:CR=1 FL=1